MAVQKTGMTLADFERFIAQPENADHLFELINGDLIEKMPTQLHAYIIQMISGFLFVFLRQHPLGYALVEARYRLPGDEENDIIPDLSFVTKARDLVQSGAAPYMPDLAVEAQSEGQSDKFMLDKALLYLANGTRMVWIIYSTRGIIEVLTPTERKLLKLEENANLDGGDLLLGLSIPLREIFPE